MTVRSSLRQNVARMIGDLTAIGTATTDDTTWLADTVNLIWPNDDALNGQILFIYEGTGLDQERWITDFTAADKKITVPTWTTALDTTSAYEIHKRFRVAEYNAAIDAAHHAARISMLLPKVDDSIILNNILTNPWFDTWTATTADAAVATGWEPDVNSTRNQESTIVYPPATYSYKLVTVNPNIGQLYQNISNAYKYAGETVKCNAWVYTNTADRVRLYVNDGVTTTYSSYAGKNKWTKLSVDKGLSGVLTTISPGFYIDAGTAVYLYAGRVEMFCAEREDLPGNIYEYTLPTGFVSVTKVEMEIAHNNYRQLSSADWSIIGDTTKRLYIPKPVSGRAIRITGQQKATVPTADTDTIGLNEEYVATFAALYLLRSKPTKEDGYRIPLLAAQLANLERTKRIGIQGKQVEVVA